MLHDYNIEYYSIRMNLTKDLLVIIIPGESDFTYSNKRI